jgi:glycosyltransferase involved in cell wall biosynthesis
MALGTPVISTNKGAEGLEVVDRKHLLLADNPTEFALRTIELFRNPDLQRHLAHNARQKVEKRYDWSEIGDKFVESVEKAVLKHRNE